MQGTVRNDGSKITSKFIPTLFGKDKIVTELKVNCFSCDETGTQTENCRKFKGAGLFILRGKIQSVPW